jgi:RHS repeat-associated protein
VILPNNPNGYTSHRFDHENGFYHYHFRKYDPVTGNWLTADPIGIAGGINLYRFVSNNPVNYRDWLGLETVGDVDDIDDPETYNDIGDGYMGEFPGQDYYDSSGKYHSGSDNSDYRDNNGKVVNEGSVDIYLKSDLN